MYDGYEVGRIYWHHPFFQGRSRVTDGIVALVENNQRRGWVLLIDSEVRMMFDENKVSLELQAHKQYAFHVDADFVHSYPHHLQMCPSAVNVCLQVTAQRPSNSACNNTWLPRHRSNAGRVDRRAANDPSNTRIIDRRSRNQRSNW